MLNEKYGRYPLDRALAPYTCGLSGEEYSATEVRDRVDKLARGLSKELGFKPNQGTEWDKVIGIFGVNAVGFCQSLSCTFQIWRQGLLLLLGGSTWHNYGRLKVGYL